MAISRSFAPLTALLLVGTSALCAADPSDSPLPPAPDGCRLRVVARFGTADQEPVRVTAGPHSGSLYVLGGGGDLTRIDPRTGRKVLLLKGGDYIEQPPRNQVNIPLPVDAKWVNSPIALRATLCLGLAFDRDARL